MTKAKKTLLKTVAMVASLAIAVASTACESKIGNYSTAPIDVSFKAVRSTWSVEKTEDASAYADLSLLDFSAAKGETEGAQFFVRSESAVSDYEFTVSDLKSGDAVVKAENVDIYAEIFTFLSESVIYVGSRGAGWYPDCLIPVDIMKNNGENKINAGENQGFWVDVNVPKDAAAGEYTGKITFKAGDFEKNINVRLTVFDFTMPESPALKTCYLIWNDWLIDTELDNTSEKHREYYDTLLKYNVRGYSFPTATPTEFVEYLTEHYDEINAYGVPYKPVNKYTNDLDYFYEYLYAIGEQCKKDGVNYFEKAYYYLDIFYDEFTSFDWREEQVLRIIQETDETEERVIAALSDGGTTFAYADTVRGLRHAITTETFIDDNEKWHGKFNFYVQNYGGLQTSADIDKYRALIESGDYTIYTYATELHDYPNPAVNISDYQITGRDVYWFDYALGIEGEMYWCVNANVLCTSVQGLRYATIYDPYRQATHDGVTNGGGYYLYPGVHYGSENPFPSMRLAVKRDGIDDYTYMSLLNDRYKSLGAKYGEEIGAVNLVGFLNERLLDGNRSKLNDDGLFAARKNLADLITFADEYGFAIADAEYNDDKINLTLYVNSGVAVTVNGKSAIGTSLGQGVKINVKADYSENGLLYLTCDKGDGAKSIVFNVKSTPKLVSAFESGNEKITVYDRFDSRVYGSAEHVRNGVKSAKIVLSGWTDFQDPNRIKDFKPSVSLSFSDYGITGNVDEAYFYVYNDGDDREYEVFVTAEIGGNTETFVADVINLKKGIWTKICVADFHFVSLKENFNVKSIGLRTENILNQDGTKYSIDLYIDDFYAVVK